MSKKNFRVTLTFKLLIMFLLVLLAANVALGGIAYKISSKGMKQSVYSHLDAISDDVVNQIKDINDKQFIPKDFAWYSATAF